MLLDAEVTIPSAMSLVRLQQRSARWQKRLSRAEQLIREGESLADALAFTGFFRSGYLQGIAWAEDQGDPRLLVLVLRLMGGDTDYRFAVTAADSEERNMDAFARRIGG